MSRSLAIALGYRPEADLAPRVIAAGGGRWAERMRQIAARHEIPLEHDAELAERLFEADVGDELPEELYVIVARVFAYLDHLEKTLLAEERATTAE